MIDTCQACTMFNKFYSPNIISIGSSKLQQSSYAYDTDEVIGLSMIDRFTYYSLEFFETITPESNITLEKMFNMYVTPQMEHNMMSSVAWANKSSRPLSDIKVTEFFASAVAVKPTITSYRVV